MAEAEVHDAGLEEERAVQHPTIGRYVRIAAFLAVVTLIEFLILGVESLIPYLGEGVVMPVKNAIVPILIGLSAIKFSYVVMFFMHLKFDDQLLTRFFLFGLVLAGLFVIVLPRIVG